MKFWEVVVCFADDPQGLEAVIGNARRREPFHDHLKHFNDLVNAYSRDVLDTLVPLELSRELAARCKRSFYLSPETGNLRGDRHSYRPSDIQMTALEVHDHFGGSVIEEIGEKGSVRVTFEVV